MFRKSIYVLAAMVVAAPAEAAPVIGLLTTIGGFFVSTFGAVLGGMLFRLSLSLILTEVAKLFRKKQRQPGIVTEHTTTGEMAPASFPMGLYATAGHHACPPYTHGAAKKTPNAYLTYIIVLADLPGVELSRMMINDEYVEFGAGTHADYGREVLVGPDKLAGWCWVKTLDGSQTEADPMLLAKFGAHPERPWLPDMIGRGLSVAIVTYRFNRKLYNGLPRNRFEVLGVPLYDPRLDGSAGGVGAHRFDDPATWDVTNNPEVMNYNIARGIRLPDGSVWGGEVDEEDLPLSDWVAAMNACDLPVDDGDGGTEPQYRAGFEVRVDEEPADVMGELNKACSAEIAEIGGVFKPRVGGVGLPVLFITDESIVVTDASDLSPFPSTEQTYNAVHASFPDPETLWNPKDAPGRYSDEYEAEDQGRRRAGSLSLNAVPYPRQVQRLMDAWMKDARRFVRHNLPLPPLAAHIEPLDAIAWTSAENGYVNGKVFEVGSVTDHQQTCNQVVAIRERDSGDYDPSGFVALPFDTPSIVPSLPAPQPIEDWDARPAVTVSEGGDDSRAAIRITWDGLDQDGVVAVHFEVSQGGQVITEGVAPDVERGEFLITDGIQADTTYAVRGRLVARSSRVTPWSDPIDVLTPGAKLAVDAPFVMSNTTRRDEIGVMHVDWEVRLSCQTGVADLFELQRKVSETEWETVGVSETGVFSLLDVFVVNFRARCRNLFGVWGDWTPEQGGVVLPQAPTPQNYAFDQLEALGLLWAKANLKVDGDATITGQSYFDGRANFRFASKHDDDVRAWFGTDFDMYIRHDNYNGEIRVEAGKGNLLTRADAHICQVNDGSGGLWTTWSAGTGGAMNLNYQGAQKAYTTSYGLNVLGRIALTAYSAGQDRTRIHFNRNAPGEGLAWIGIPDWQPDAYYFYMPTSAGVQSAAARYRNDEWTFWANSVEALRIQEERLLMKVPPKLPDYTVASAPSAAALGAGAQIWITDALGGATQANSNGANWLRVRDNVVVA